jgi:hypothetical protein
MGRVNEGVVYWVGGRPVSYPFDFYAEEIGDLEDERILLLEVLVAFRLGQENFEQQTRHTHVFHVGLSKATEEKKEVSLHSAPTKSEREKEARTKRRGGGVRRSTTGRRRGGWRAGGRRGCA